MTNRRAQFDEIYDYLITLREGIKTLTKCDTELLARLERIENILAGNHPEIPALCGKCNSILRRNNDPNALLTIYCLNCLREATRGDLK